MTVRWTSDADPTEEILWIAREANALTTERVPKHSERWAEFRSRKRALMEYVEQERASRPR